MKEQRSGWKTAVVLCVVQVVVFLGYVLISAYRENLALAYYMMPFTFDLAVGRIVREALLMTLVVSVVVRLVHVATERTLAATMIGTAIVFFIVTTLCFPRGAEVAATYTIVASMGAFQ